MLVVGVDRLLGAHLAAQHLDGAVRDHLIGVHVRLGARTRLPDDQREVVVQLAFDHFIGGGDDGVGQLGVQLAQVAVGLGGGALDDAQGAHDRQGLLFPADLEVAERALGLRAPVAIGGDLDGAEGVGFDTNVAHVRGTRLSGVAGRCRAV